MAVSNGDQLKCNREVKMKTKKKDDEKNPHQTQDKPENDYKNFCAAFQKPTKIYRFLRTRHLVYPVFLQRTVYYMKHRRSVNNSKRKDFKVDSLLQRVVENDRREQEVQTVRTKYLKLDVNGFYNNSMSPDVHQVSFEAILVKKQHGRKDLGSSVKQTSLGKVTIPVNPIKNHSCLDGTQTIIESNGPGKTTLMSKEGFTFSPRNMHSYVLSFTVTCRKQALSNGVLNGHHCDQELNYIMFMTCHFLVTTSPVSIQCMGTTKSSSFHNYITVNSDDEPSPKRSRTTTNDACVRSENVTVYSTQLTLISKQCNFVLKAGTYELVLQEFGTMLPCRDSQWERAYGKRAFDTLEVFGSCPTLKFYLCWTDDPTGLHRCKIPPFDFIKNNQFAKSIIQSAQESSPLKIKEESQCMPQKKVKVNYQFQFNNNTCQVSDILYNMKCPWCSLNCDQLYSLLKHLRLCHARFNIIYVPTPKGPQIDISLDDSYDGAYAGNPQDLISHGFAFHRQAPVQRTSLTHVIVYRPKRPSPLLLEFCEPEKEYQVSRQIIQGHNRLYYRTNTCLPLKPQEVNDDSEDEVTPHWLCQKSVNLIDEFTDVNEGEKELMKMWNLHCMKYAYISDCQIPLACQSFVEEQGRKLLQKGIIKNFLIHLVNMFDYSLLTPDIAQRTMWQLYTIKDDMEMSGDLASDHS